MLRINQNNSPEGASKYFDENLSKSDYYDQEGKIAGLWGGRAALALGLSGEVQRDHFHNLCFNINPVTQERLTARNDVNRTTGYDFTFSVPKSVSIIYSQTNDPDILAAMNAAIAHAMTEAEKNAETRVRKGGKYDNRVTGNLMWAAFTHDDARPVNGIPDPHLHQHVFVFNATFDPVEKKWKAGQFRNLKAEAPYFEALFHNRLALELKKSGYLIERNERDFEIAGFTRQTIEKFSNRTLEVNQKAKEMGLKYAEDKAALGAKTRANKRTGLDKAEVKKDWANRLTPEELKLIHSAKNKNRTGSDTANGDAAKIAIDHALEHGLERKSVIAHNELMVTALKQGMGSVTKEELEAEINSRKDLLSKEINRKNIYTSKAALAEEKKLIDAARSGHNQYKPIHPGYIPKNKELSEEQGQAAKHALESRDFISIITGAAGTGKTWTMKEIAQGIKEKGLGFHAFAPSSAASHEVQREEGFRDATTIAALLQSKKLQDQIIKGDTIWLDEAGLIGCKDLNDVIKLAKEKEARILLTGDTRQHTAVQRGDALRILQKFGGIKPAYINTIQRQKKEIYKDAIKALSEGHIKQGYEKLDQMGAIKESGSFEGTVNALAQEYVTARKSKESVLVVAPTHKQGQALTAAIRDGLKKDGKLAKKDQLFDMQTSLSFTEAQKKDKASYRQGQSIQFHQNVKGLVRGAKYDVVGNDETGNVLVSLGKQVLTLPINEAKNYAVYETGQIGLAKGDLIRITQNGFSNDKKRLSNSNILTVKGFDEHGNIMALTSGNNEIVLDKNHRNFTYGYYTTSPGAQGKSVNRVLILQTTHSGKAASKEQFYVSASRGKFEISIHTDSKERLLDSVQRTSTRMSAIEIAAPEKGRVKRVKEKLKNMQDATRSKATDIKEALKGKTLGNTNTQEIIKPGPARSR